MLVLQTENVWQERILFSFYLGKIQRLFPPTYTVVVEEFCSSYALWSQLTFLELKGQFN